MSEPRELFKPGQHSLHTFVTNTQHRLREPWRHDFRNPPTESWRDACLGERTIPMGSCNVVSKIPLGSCFRLCGSCPGGRVTHVQVAHPCNVHTGKSKIPAGSWLLFFRYPEFFCQQMSLLFYCKHYLRPQKGRNM